MHPYPLRTSPFLAFPSERSELIRLYTLSEQDLSVIKQRRAVTQIALALPF